MSLIQLNSTAETRFWPKVDAFGDCWQWVGCIGKDGYGSFNSGFGTRRAHLVCWALLVGVVPEFHQLDHLCRNRGCVNPDHLEPVTQAVNLARGYGGAVHFRRKTKCPQEHPYDEQNTRWYRGRRYCRACLSARHEVSRITLRSRRILVSTGSAGGR